MERKHPARPAPRWFDAADVAIVAACSSALEGGREAKLQAHHEAIVGAFCASKNGPPTVRFIWGKLDHFFDHADRAAGGCEPTAKLNRARIAKSNRYAAWSGSHRLRFLSSRCRPISKASLDPDGVGMFRVLREVPLGDSHGRATTRRDGGEVEPNASLWMTGPPSVPPTDCRKWPTSQGARRRS